MVMRTLFFVFSACGAPQVVVIPTQLQSAVLDPATVQSYELWVLGQVGRDGQPLRCDQLLSRELTPASDNAHIITRVAGAFTESVHLVDLPIGQQNRIFYVDLYDQPDGLGTRVGAGCAQSVSIDGGKTIQVELSVDRTGKQS